VEAVPDASILLATLEDAELAPVAFDSVVAATSMHWVYFAAGLSKLHASLRPGGWPAVWRHRFGDGVSTPSSGDAWSASWPSAYVGTRSSAVTTTAPRWRGSAPARCSKPVRTRRWRCSIDLGPAQVRALFRTFSDWSDSEVEAVHQAAVELGRVVREHYQSVLHLLQKAPGRTGLAP
jgi:hypothetical protein